MNIIQMQDRLKDLSDNQLRTYVEKPRNMQGSGVGQGGTSGGYVPTFLVLGEIKRRKDSRSKYEGEKAQQKTTVAEDLVTEQGIGNQMTRNPMSQPTAGVGTPQPQEPVNPAMLASKGIGQLNPGAVKQMNDGGIVGYAGKDGVSLVGEDKSGLKEIQAKNQQTDYSLGNFIQQASDYNNKYFGEASVAPTPTGSYSQVGEFFSSFTDPENPTERLENNKDKALQLINNEKLKYSYGMFDKITDEERAFNDGKLLELEDIKKNLLDDTVGPKAPEEIISETITDETITKDVGQGNSNQGLSGEGPPDSGAPEFLNNMAMEKQREEMIEKGYNRFNPAGGPVEPVKNYTVADYQKELDEANTAFGIEDREAFYANRNKLIESEKEDIRKEQQDDLNANLMQTGFDIMETGNIAAGAKRGVERYTRSEKDARKMKKLVDKEMRAVDGMERAEARGDAKGYMKERKVRKDTQLKQIKMNMDAYGDFLKSQADKYGKRSKDWIAAVSEATKIHGSSQANVASRYAGNDAAFKRDIYVTATEIFEGKIPSFIDPGSANTLKERGPGIYTDKKALTSFIN